MGENSYWLFYADAENNQLASTFIEKIPDNVKL